MVPQPSVMASNRSRLLWQNGVSLATAWRVFADPAESARLDMEFDHNSAKNSISGQKSRTAIAARVFDALFAIHAANVQMRELSDSLKEDLLERLFNGDLTATAYREQPSTSASPIELAPDDFEFADADWENARLFVNGKTYGRVRVIDERDMGDAELPNPRRGRPGSTAAIDAAINAMLSRRIDLQAMYRSEACQLIRVELGVPEKRGNGLSDINLSKRIVVKCGIKAVRK